MHRNEQAKELESPPDCLRTWSWVAGDPLRDITELQRIQFVMNGGTMYLSQ